MGNQTVSSIFTKKDIEILLKTTGKNQDEIRQWYEEFHVESEQTNRLNKRQFKKYYSRLKNRSDLDQLTEHIFRVFDTDHSGTIEFSEFILSFIATTDGNIREKLEYAFEVYDINDNQLIDKKEAEKILGIICRILGFSENDAQAYTKSIMLSFDTNRDKVLTKSEFIDGCLYDSVLGKISNPFTL